MTASNTRRENLWSMFLRPRVYAKSISISKRSFFIGQEYSDGTIHNKIISGKKRTDIYLANFVTCTLVSVILCCGFFLMYLLAGIPILGFFFNRYKGRILAFSDSYFSGDCIFSYLYFDCNAKRK